MSQVVIDNPVINSPYREPTRHFRFTDDGITDTIDDGRRTSSYFVPIAQPRKKSKQLAFDTEWTKDCIEENRLVNQIRERVKIWRQGGYMDVTPTTGRLLAYWTAPDRERKLFFCQVEALETVIYLTEVARKYGDTWIENKIRDANDTSNPGLPRVAFKMATGSGKTVVMAMLIAWHTLNKPEDYILAIVEFAGDAVNRVHYLRRPFQREPDFGVTSVNYDFGKLLMRAGTPR